MISPRYPASAARGQPRPKGGADRWLVGAVAGAALVYLLGRTLGLGRKRPAAGNPPKQD
jgi:hypothetical protein